jgi:hypothetical protein
MHTKEADPLRQITIEGSLNQKELDLDGAFGLMDAAYGEHVVVITLRR